MRNPWGVEKYTGPWHDEDDRWTPEFKKQAKMVKANDGVFYMNVASFKKAFTVYNIANYSNWHTSNINVKGKGKKFMRRFTSDADQEIIVSVDYQNHRQIPHGCATPDVFYNIYIVANGKLMMKGKAVNK